MRFLLDTQIFLWFLGDARRIPRRARETIMAPEHAVFVSSAVVWEIAIKASLGRLGVSAADLERMSRLIADAGFDELPVLVEHAGLVHRLPWHHRDPFDRLLVAQAKAEGLTVITVDPALRAYDVPIVP